MMVKSKKFPVRTTKPAFSTRGEATGRITSAFRLRSARTLSPIVYPFTVRQSGSKRPAARSSDNTAGTPPAR